MKFPELNASIEKLNAKRAQLKALFDEAKNDSGEFDASAVSSANLPTGVAFAEHVAGLNTELEDLVKDVSANKALALAADAAMAAPELVETDSGTQAKAASVSFGDAFVASAAYKQMQGVTGPQSTLDVDVRNTLFERTAGHAPESTRTGYIDLSPQRPLSVVDFVPQHPTAMAAIKFMRETTVDASLIVEKAEGLEFGEAELELTEVTIPVEKIPAFIPVTDEQLEDVDGIRAYIDGRLAYMVNRRLDGQILVGTGVTPLLQGTANVTGIQTQPIGTDAVADGLYKLFDLIRDDVANGGGDADPSVVHMRAAAWQPVALMKTTDGVYIWGPPSARGPLTMWGVPVNLTNAAPAASAIAGDYLMHSYLAVKRGIDVQISNSHSDYFIKGKQAIRADIRVAMVHLRPSAFGELTGL